MPRTAEATRVQASTIKQGGAAPVHQLKTPVELKTPAAKPPMGKPATQHRDQLRGRPAARWHPPGTKPYGCWNCGLAARHAKEDCPAFGKECIGCHKTGHFQAVCTQGRSSTPKPETAGSRTIHSITPDDMVELGVSPATSDSTVFIRVLPDSGASIDAIPAAIFWSHFKHIPLFEGGPNAVTATGAAISSLGHFPATLSWSSGSSLPMATTIHVLRDL